MKSKNWLSVNPTLIKLSPAITITSINLFIKDIIGRGNKIILIPRPRRFGKTLNISMLKYFYDCCPENTFYSPDQENKQPNMSNMIEFKAIEEKDGETVDSAVESALKQIEDKQYETELIERGITNIKKLAIVFCGKDVFVKPAARAPHS